MRTLAASMLLLAQCLCLVHCRRAVAAHARADAAVALSLPRERAVAIAEQFVTAQGYTQNKVILTESNVVREAFENLTVEQIYGLRAGTLLPTAWGALQGREGWVIAFRFRVENDPDNVRGVQVSADGSHVEMRVEPMRSSWFQPLGK